jgi:hypothetical protein
MSDALEPTRLIEPVWLEPYPDVLLEGMPDRSLPRRLADEAGVERRLHPHALRHTYAANGSRGHADSCAIRSAMPPWRHGPIAMGRGPCPRHRDDDAQGVELGGKD